jgi:hypothetical protein
MIPSLLAAPFQALGNFAVLFLVIMYRQGPGASGRSAPRCCSGFVQAAQPDLLTRKTG